MILSEFWDLEQRNAINCKTKEEAQTLMYYFDKLGKKWCSGERYTESHNNWDMYKKNTCYSNYNAYCSKDYYVKNGCQVIYFEDVIAYAEVVNDDCYSFYDEWFGKIGCPELKERFNYGEFTKVGKRYLILKTGLHPKMKKNFLHC